MSELRFDIVGWLGASIGEPLEQETLGSLQIIAGVNGIPVTEVEDTLAQTVRNHINVPAYSLACWLIANWWRLRWEPFRENPSYDWLCSHSMAAIGGDSVWPALTFSSDGEFIQMRLQAETSPDVSAVRYLREVAIDVPAKDFEDAVDRFLDLVEARLMVRVPGSRELTELRAELRQERAASYQLCKLQALAGLDPGAADQEWLAAADALINQAGINAAEEILAVSPTLHGGLGSAKAAIDAMANSSTTVKLDWVPTKPSSPSAKEIPWERGVRLARELRQDLGIPPGPIEKATLEQLLGDSLPLPKSSWTGQRQLRGGYRNGAGAAVRTAVLMTSAREDSQRFYLGRLIGAAAVCPTGQQVLPVSDVATAFQRFQRSFAQEFLCPWQDLVAFFTDEAGIDDEAIAEAASYFSVSERLVLTTLVNRGKLPRSRLQEWLPNGLI
jgi:hypothetical protein